ncbi:sensory transduction histidine kinase [hydrothermal vent metagenome]|uniref:histidine kinase n=1 Tax=hydrothermal vent metagenome TaxID=652676 RepID=A0A1W1CUI7_9ZZZZ
MDKNLDYKALLLRGILYAYLLGSFISVFLAIWEGDYLAVKILVISSILSIILLWQFHKYKNLELISLIWLWAISLSIFILVVGNGFRLEIVLALLIPLLAAMLLSRRMLLIHGSVFFSIFFSILLYGYVVHPEYIFFSDINIISTFLTLLFFMLAIAVIYHLYIESAYKELASSNAEKEILLQEIHHRVKNNLNMMSSILGLQAKSDNPETLKLIQANRQRLDSIAMVHEILYDSKNFTHINFKDYIDKLTHHLLFACSKEKISIRIDSQDILLYLDTMASLGLIMQELLTNSLKYAVDNGGYIDIKLSYIENDLYTLSYSDSGVDTINEVSKGLGIKLIELKTKQLDGQMFLDKSEGFSYKINFYNKNI